MSVPQATPFTTSPNRQTGRATYSADADTRDREMEDFQESANEIAVFVNGAAISANTNASDAASAKASAEAAQTGAEQARDDAIALSGADVWASGTYSIGDAVISPINFATYRDSVGGASTVDPSLDTDRWIAPESVAYQKATARMTPTRVFFGR